MKGDAFVRTSRLGRIGVLLRLWLRNLASSPVYLFAILISFAMVMVLATLTFSVREGLRAQVEASAEPDLFFMLSVQANSELISQVIPAQLLYLRRIGGVARGTEGKPLVSPELALLMRDKPKGTPQEFILRGVTEAAFRLAAVDASQPYVRLIEGRKFEPGRNELIVGAGLAHHYSEYELGRTVSIRGLPWTIVGVFSAGGSVRESEFWADFAHLRTSYGLGETYSVVSFVGMPGTSAENFTRELDGLEKDRLVVRDSRTHYAGQGENLMDIVLNFGLIFTVVAGMVIVAGVAALCESLLLNQQREMRMLRLIGYGREIAMAFVLQVALLALVGGLVGGALCLVLFSGTTFTTFSQSREIVFEATTSASLLATMVAYCVSIGLLGALLATPRAVTAASR